MKRLVLLLLSLSVLLGGCSVIPATEAKQYNATFLNLFDTLTTIVGRGASQEEFREKAQHIHDKLLEYHELFDIYNEYPNPINLCTLNKEAAKAPVSVDPRIMALLVECKELYTATGGKVNVAMGAVLSLWHETRSEGRDDPTVAVLPEQEALTEGSLHCNIDDLILDETGGTVFFADPLLQLDVGAIAKGWATQRVAEETEPGFLISVGGNVCATGPKDDKGTPWVIGIQDPDGGENYLHTIYVEKGCVVTSGDYQRAYVVDGKLYHHIIDPETLFPSEYWRSVSVVCEDSAVADALSTALFLLPLEEGQKLLETFGAQALWVDAQGQRYYSPGFQEMIRT